MNGKRWAIVGAALLGIALGVGLLRLQAGPHEFVGTVYADEQVAADFTLTADDGEPASLHDYRGKVVLLYFGYTFCPDICPAVLSELAGTLDTLTASDRERVQVVMVSIDPGRDTPGVLAEYLDHFDPAFVGLTGSEKEITDVAAAYNVFFEAQPGTAATGYLVDHWAGVYLVDPEGNLVESFSYGTTGEQIAADVVEWL